MHPIELHEPPEPEDRSLDLLLQQAVWPAASERSANRLRERWETHRREFRMFAWRPVLAVAASIGAIFLGAKLLEAFRSSSPHVRMPIARMNAVIKPQSPEPGRPATPMEIAMLRVMNEQMQASGSSVVVSPSGVALVPMISGWSVTGSTPANTETVVAPTPPRSAEPVDLQDALVLRGPDRSAGQVLNSLARGESAKAMVDAIARHPAGWSNFLFAALNNPHTEVRSHAAEALAKIDGPVITARLIAMADADINRREAVAALVRIPSPAARQFVRAAEKERKLGAIVRSAIAQNIASEHTTGDLR